MPFCQTYKTHSARIKRKNSYFSTLESVGSLYISCTRYIVLKGKEFMSIFDSLARK